MMSMQREQLLARIHRKFQTVTETHAIGPLRLPFTRVADPDVVLDQIVEEEDRRERLTGQRREGNELHLPYWAELWDSALGIGQFLASNFDKETRRQGDKRRRTQFSILDLGCGMGFAGMTAAAFGAKVLLADIEADALLFARLNTFPWAERVRARRVDWSVDRLDESFDLILGSDVLYDRKQWEAIEQFLQVHLKTDGSVLLGEPGRQTGDMFPDWIVQYEWKTELNEQAVATRDRPIRIFRLKRR
jgi:predicted nicotinamide N-methyase